MEKPAKDRGPGEMGHAYTVLRGLLERWLGTLPHHDGRAMYAAIGLKEGWTSMARQIMGTIRGLPDLSPFEKDRLLLWFNQQVEWHWSYFRDLRDRRRRVSGRGK